VAGDSAHRDKDGYFWIMGRIDDVLKVSGHRLGTMEIESALVANPRVAEAAVVGKPHEIKGESVFAYVVLRGARPTGSSAVALTRELRDWVGEQLGPIAKPDDIRFADNLPKTRSGKIMRRLLRSVANGEEVTQDVSTLENPAILEQLRGTDKGGKAAKPVAPRAKKPAKKAAKKAAKPKAAKSKAARKPAARKAASRKAASRKRASSRKKPQARRRAAPKARR
jgi:hypothetical protein